MCDFISAEGKQQLTKRVYKVGYIQGCPGWKCLDQIFIFQEQMVKMHRMSIFGASALEQILSFPEREICSNTTIGQP